MNAVRVGLAVAGATAGLMLAAGPAGAATPAPVAGAAAKATPTAALSARAATCDAGAWGTRIQGRPAGFSGGDRGGVYLWHTSSGLNLRVTHKGDDRAVYTGVITSPEKMRLDPVKLERGDVLRLAQNGHAIVFAFVDYGHIDGVRFHTDCASQIRVSNLNVGNHRLSVDRVYLGAKEVHPLHVPFTVHRTDSA